MQSRHKHGLLLIVSLVTTSLVVREQRIKGKCVWALSGTCAHHSFGMAGLGEVQDIGKVETTQSAIATAFLLQSILDTEPQQLLYYLQCVSKRGRKGERERVGGCV